MQRSDKKLVAVVEPMTKAGPAIPVGLMENCAHGDVDAIPRNPADVKVDVAVPPNDAALAVSTLPKRFVVVAFVAVRPPLNAMFVVVALFGKR